MFNWYSRAGICYAYLDDVVVHSDQGDDLDQPTDGTSSLRRSDDRNKSVPIVHFQAYHLQIEVVDTATISSLVASRWFTRGWTLQELIAPGQVIFFGKNWKLTGGRIGGLLSHLSKRTGIDEAVLMRFKPLSDYSIAQRMSWAALRETSRKEDEAYCLLGIFGVNMPLLYGEENKAFERLQEEIIRSHTDHSIFAWQLPIEYGDDSEMLGYRGPLAPSPVCFRNCSDVVEGFKIRPNRPFQRNNLGISITLPLTKQGSRTYAGILQCYKQGNRLALLLQWTMPEDGSLEGEEDVFDLNLAHGTRLLDVDTQEVSKGTRRSIIIRMGNSMPYRRNKLYLDRNSDTLWFRLKNCVTTHTYRVRDVWPPDLWERCEEGDSRAFPTDRNRDDFSIVAKFKGVAADRVGGVVLSCTNSSQCLALYFLTEAKAGTRRFRMTVLDERTLEDLCTTFKMSSLPSSYANREFPMDAQDFTDEGVKDLDGIAEARVVMKLEREPYETALEVTIAHTAGSSRPGS